MHLNRKCRFPDLSDLFYRVDVATKVRERVDKVEQRATQILAALAGLIPAVPIGAHCTIPYECPFKSRCWPKLPTHHISTLYKISDEKTDALKSNFGITEISEISDQIKLSPIQARQVSAVKQNRCIAEPTLSRELNKIQYPVAYLDFETISPAVPLWAGCGPYHQVAVQFSCHVDDGRGSLRHFEWLSNDSTDPRIGIVEPLLAACESAATIVAYHAPFEKKRIAEIAKVNPTHADRIESLNDRFIDLLPIMRNNVYHPRFLGSFSIKDVLPALINGIQYSDLKIADGLTAAVLLEQLITQKLPVPEVNRVVSELLEYCRLDTWAMYLLVKELTAIARGAGA